MITDKRVKETIIKRGEKETVVVGSEAIKISLVGEGAEVRVLGMLVGRGEELREMSVEVVHAAPKTKAEIILKGVVFDGAKINIRGSVIINKGARLAEDSLREDVLLVGEKARGETYPYLEIEENDVVAKHAATVGQIDREQLFYLMTRGVGKLDGENLLVKGFFEPLFESVSSAQRAKMLEMISTKRKGTING